ncbi:MAG TPA: hypothetical protein PKY59_06465 [Pyrinomonadaceae bacterium]|nr:hypothetical protein [Pyrinomonadaceae bacterium]
MENKGQLTAQDIQIQGVLDNFLKLRAKENTSATTHLDEDSLTAFVEGNLSRRESQPIVSHLVDCSFCRHITAELVKLDYAFAETEEIRPVVSETAEPSRISEVLSGLLSRIFGSNEEAVFALEEKEEDSEKDKKDEQTKEE